MKSEKCRMEAKEWCITAISRLTHEREVVSGVMTHTDAMKVLCRMLGTRASKRSYIYPSVRPYMRGLGLFD